MLPSLLILMAGVGVAATEIEITSTYRAAREREEELFFRGLAYVHAINAFYLAEKDPARRRLPRDLHELESDPRFPNRRHIRRLYSDPLTGADFRLLRDGSGGVLGVASTCRKPLFSRQRASAALALSAGATRYDELLFEIDPKLLEKSKINKTRGLPAK